LGDPFASNLEPFPWLNLQVFMGERWIEREMEERRREGPPRFGAEVLVK
jgi:hypothetical protein